MAAHHFLHFILLSLILLIGVAWIEKTNNNDEDDIDGQPSISESLSMTEHWPSVEDSEIDVEEEEDDDHLTSGTATVEQEASLACRCWSAPAETGSFLETECKCRGRRITSVPSSLPTDVHRMWVTLKETPPLFRGNSSDQTLANTFYESTILETINNLETYWFLRVLYFGKKGEQESKRLEVGAMKGTEIAPVLPNLIIYAVSIWNVGWIWKTLKSHMNVG